MNKFIKEELDRLNNLPAYDDNTTSLFIPRGSISSILKIEEPMFQTGRKYLIEVEQYVVDEPPSFTLSTNWNGGTKPTSLQMEATVNKTMGKMINFTARSIPGNMEWTGWIPQGAIKRVEII